MSFESIKSKFAAFFYKYSPSFIADFLLSALWGSLAFANWGNWSGFAIAAIVCFYSIRSAYLERNNILLHRIFEEQSTVVLAVYQGTIDAEGQKKTSEIHLQRMNAIINWINPDTVALHDED